MPNRQKQKGYRVERKMVEWMTGMGLKVRKVPLSGQTLDFKDDLEIEWRDGHDGPLRAEVKARKSPPPWLTIKKWLGEADLLFLVEDHQDPLVVMPGKLYDSIMRELARAWAAEKGMVDTPHPVQLTESERGWD